MNILDDPVQPEIEKFTTLIRNREFKTIGDIALRGLGGVGIGLLVGSAFGEIFAEALKYVPVPNVTLNPQEVNGGNEYNLKDILENFQIVIYNSKLNPIYRSVKDYVINGSVLLAAIMGGADFATDRLKYLIERKTSLNKE